MIRAKIKSNIRLPKLKIQKDLVHIAEKIFIPLLQKGITNRRAVDGKSFPKLEPETIKRKGHDKPLWETGKLRRAFKFRRQGKNTVIISLRADRADIGKALQINGIHSKHGTKHFNFFGITREMEGFAINFMEQRINEELGHGR